jgi:acyl-CoA synthetase (AMP-forming)/AMP-acid ligase II
MSPRDETTLHGIFAAGAAGSPNSICLKLAGQKGRTYAEVSKAVRRVASHVAAMPGHTVAVVAERSCEMIFALLGIMTAGKAYCPIYPETTLKFMLAMTKAAELQCVLVPAFQEPLIIYRLNWKVYYVGIMGTVTCCDRAQPDGKDGSLRGYAMAPTAPLPTTQSDSMAYVLFSAGSTGQLAGKSYTHKESTGLITPLSRRLNCPTGQKFLFMTPYVAQTSVLEMFACFAESGTLVIAPNTLDNAGNRNRFWSGGSMPNSPLADTSPPAGRERFTSALVDRREKESAADELAAPTIADLFNREMVDVCFLPPALLQKIVDYVDVAPKMGTIQGASHLLQDDLGWLAFAETSSPAKLATLKRVVVFGAVDEATRTRPIFANAEVLSVPDVQLGTPLAGARYKGSGMARSKSDGGLADEVEEEEEIEPEIVQRVDLIMDGSMPVVPQTKQVKAMRAGNLRWRVGNAQGLKGQISKATVI